MRKQVFAAIIALACCAQAPAPIVVPAEPSVGHLDKFGSAGGWQIVGGGQGDPSCSIESAQAGTALSVTAQFDTPGALRLSLDHFERPQVQSKRSTLMIDFEGGKTVFLNGTTTGMESHYKIEKFSIAAWLHEFTARSGMSITEDGVVAGRLDLSGSSVVVNALADCVTSFKIAGMPPPFPQIAAAPREAAPAPQVETAQPASSLSSQPSLGLQAAVGQTEMGCNVAVKLVNRTKIDLQSLFLQAEVFTGDQSNVESFSWEFVDAGKDRANITTVFQHLCSPQMRMVVRDVSLCKIDGRMFSDCGDLLQGEASTIPSPWRSIPVEIKLPHHAE